MRRVGEIIDEIDLKGKNEELIDELVALSTRHGIITPYTSFLADEDLNRRDLAEHRQAASEELSFLGVEAGRAGFVQRDFKAQLQRAAQAPAAGFGVPARRACGCETFRKIGRSRSGPCNRWGARRSSCATVAGSIQFCRLSRNGRSGASNDTATSTSSW